ncbi:hypothetical protein OGATHE_005693 [Ogataea polymorpha]|uniref:Uncharacterized protein n=1 Tax=Ogataea polymorpha TaxID=460523 RepID=A0A9P8NSJ2_9ASCO|nr:hypothetical protein OGATHE_005693 [Ogataea polymorpha]
MWTSPSLKMAAAFMEESVGLWNRPARAVGAAVLKSPWNLGVEQPDSRHIVVGGGRVGGSRHLELKHKHLGSTGKTVVGRDAGSVVATVSSRRVVTIHARHDQELDVRVDGDLIESDAGRRGRLTVGTAVGDRVTEAVGESAGSRTTQVIEEGDIVFGAWSALRGGLVVSVRSRSSFCGRRGSAFAGDDLHLCSGCTGGTADRVAVLVDVHGRGDRNVVNSSSVVMMSMDSGLAFLFLFISLHLGRGRRWVVDAELQQLQRTSEVHRKFLVQRRHGTRERLGLGGTLARGLVDVGDVRVRARVADTFVDDGVCLGTVVVAVLVRASGMGSGPDG